MPKRSTVIVAVVAAAAVVAGSVAAAVALIPSGPPEKTTVTMRLWDDQVAAAYETSFAEFEKANEDITVDVQVIGWADYWTKLRTDIAGKSIDDIFWVNGGNFVDYANNGDLLDITEALGADAQKAWAPSVVAQYSLNGSLWGVPQLADPGIGMFYNEDLVRAAGIDPTSLSSLHWDPTGADDTLLPVLKKLTVDANGNTADSPQFDPKKIVQYGYNAANDLNAIYINYLGSNGAALQSGDEFVFDSPAGVAAFQYLVDLINVHHVSPSAADTNTNGDFSRDQFTQGKMALFQSGVYNLANVEQGADFPWSVATMPAGPAGAISVTNGVVAAANAHSAHPDAVKKVLQWLGSEAGSAPIGATGSASPAVTAAQQVYLDFWNEKGIGVTPFFDVLANGTVQAPQGAKWQAAQEAFGPVFEEIFLGRTPVAEGLATAQQAANAAIK
ncbi:sugar ABC transporter substrate-binding protein [Homoserinimonas sp. OAct 916]|uniref:ABC transporter substrate-binding protein n=1 Tax=Homoserinimonas sp. OAct 916 TaxID=2211450 RepID=UPI000DBE7E1A|nr:sugar ABC transporter substrate-binding protein [Homoserinimonas sp. OAct 916]